MGSLVVSKWRCGFESDMFGIGGGMISRNKEYYFPYYCDDCKIVFEKNILDNSGSKLKKYNKCLKCLKKVKYYGSIKKINLKQDLIPTGPSGDLDIDFRFDLDERYQLNYNNNYCPKCKKNHLKFELVGGWD